jgi:hypothetical protein
MKVYRTISAVVVFEFGRGGCTESEALNKLRVVAQQGKSFRTSVGVGTQDEIRKPLIGESSYKCSESLSG